jgi:hypothetical protein
MIHRKNTSIQQIYIPLFKDMLDVKNSIHPKKDWTGKVTEPSLFTLCTYEFFNFIIINILKLLKLTP